MSTKITLLHSREPADFHLYRECGDEENLYLEIPAGPHTIHLTIPMGVAFAAAHKISVLADSVRRCSDSTDSQILDSAAGEVEARIFHRGNPLAEMMGILVYGNVDDPPEVQIARGVQSMTDERERCRRQVELADRLIAGK